MVRLVLQYVICCNLLFFLTLIILTLDYPNQLILQSTVIWRITAADVKSFVQWNNKGLIYQAKLVEVLY